MRHVPASLARPIVGGARRGAVRALRLAASVVLLAWGSARGAEPSIEYPEPKPGVAGKGKLECIEGVPVLHLYGDPGDRGRQQAQLLAPQFRALRRGYLDRLLEGEVERKTFALAAMGLVPRMPPEYVAELKAISAASGEPYADVLVANTFLDLMRTVLCSVAVASGEATQDGKLLLARNLDFPAFGIAQKASLVTVYHHEEPGRHSFVSVGWPWIVGVISGMNDAGLCVATLVSLTERGVASGMPYPMMYRQILERCTTPQEALELVKATPRASANNLAVAAPAGEPLVIEFSPRVVAARRPERGVILATNHFRSPGLARPEELGCDRYATLRRLTQEQWGQIGIPALQAMLRAVQGTEPEWNATTLQSMVFEPAARRLHLAIGHVPAADGRYVVLDCARLLAGDAP